MRLQKAHHSQLLGGCYHHGVEASIQPRHCFARVLLDRREKGGVSTRVPGGCTLFAGKGRQGAEDDDTATTAQ